MIIQVSEESIEYTGTQLSPHWIYHRFGLLGDALISFQGPCHVALDKMVDQVDVRENKPICSDLMLHFIGEFFGPTLSETILWLRLLVSLAQEEIVFRTKNPTIIRGSNDLYDGDAKLSVAIATASPISTLIHFGINITNTGTPIKTKGLNDYNINSSSFAKSLLESFKNEWMTAREARSKVKPVF